MRKYQQLLSECATGVLGSQKVEFTSSFARELSRQLLPLLLRGDFYVSFNEQDRSEQINCSVWCRSSRAQHYLMPSQAWWWGQFFCGAMCRIDLRAELSPKKLVSPWNTTGYLQGCRYGGRKDLVTLFAAASPALQGCFSHQMFPFLHRLEENISSWFLLSFMVQ